MKGAGKQTVSVPGQLYGGGRVLLHPSGRYLKDSDRKGSIRGQAMLGVTATFGVEMTTQISAFFLSAGLSLSVSAAGMLGVEMGLSWKDNGWPSLHNLKLDTGTSGMSVMIRLQIGFAGAGIGANVR